MAIGAGVVGDAGGQVTFAEMFGDVIKIEPDMSIRQLILQNHVPLS
jgi:hypothetical protein